MPPFFVSSEPIHCAALHPELKDAGRGSSGVSCNFVWPARWMAVRHWGIPRIKLASAVAGIRLGGSVRHGLVACTGLVERTELGPGSEGFSR